MGAEPLGLTGAGFEHLGAEFGGRWAGGHLGELGERDGGDLDVQVDAEEADGLGQAADRIDIQSLDDGRLGGVDGGHEQPIATLGDGLEGHREDSLDGPGLTGEGQLADDGEIAGPVERDLTAGQQQSQRDRPGANVHWLVSLRRFWRGLTWLVPGRAKTSPAGVAYAVPGTPRPSDLRWASQGLARCTVGGCRAATVLSSKRGGVLRMHRLDDSNHRGASASFLTPRVQLRTQTVCCPHSILERANPA